MDQREFRTVVLGYRRIRGWKMKDSKMTDQLQRLNQEYVLCRRKENSGSLCGQKSFVLRRARTGGRMELQLQPGSSANRKGHKPRWS